MTDSSTASSASTAAIPADDPSRKLSLIDPDDPKLRHVAVVGDTYTVLLSGAQTAGKYCLIEMNVPHCGGPGPHRHDFEEMFHVLEGEIEFTFRGKKQVVKRGMTVNIPANAPHFFTNSERGPARMLCMCAPAGQEEFFMAIGTPVDGRSAPAPKLSKDEQAAFLKKAGGLAPSYRTEILEP
jgi:mannose-6-phosphate isomerase-like protein (cupin superfamily)